jgi:hypothetical protein
MTGERDYFQSERVGLGGCVTSWTNVLIRSSGPQRHS